MNSIYVSFEDAKKITKEDLVRLSEYEVIPEDEFKTGKARRLYPKWCYERAFNYVESKKHIENVKLVHGLYKPYSIESHSGHAWTELPRGIIFDGVLQGFYKKEDYYNYYQIIKLNEYTAKDLWSIGRKSGGNFGPWNKDK